MSVLFKTQIVEGPKDTHRLSGRYFGYLLVPWVLPFWFGDFFFAESTMPPSLTLGTPNNQFFDGCFVQQPFPIRKDLGTIIRLKRWHQKMDVS